MQIPDLVILVTGANQAMDFACARIVQTYDAKNVCDALQYPNYIFLRGEQAGIGEMQASDVILQSKCSVSVGTEIFFQPIT